MLRRAFNILQMTAEYFIASESFTRGAAIAFYSVTSLVPVLVIIIAIAGLVFGEVAARGALVNELAGLLGRPSADLIQAAIKSAYASGSNVTALVFGTVVLIVTASGVFGELQAALNAIWKVETPAFSFWRLLQDRLVGLGLIVALGFLLLVSLVFDAGVAATSSYISLHVPHGGAALSLFNTLLSYVLTAILFAAVYRVLPDAELTGREVLFGALITAFAFESGKALISVYLGQSMVISSYGAAGALASIVLWIYYSSQIFLLCAALTKACAASQPRRETATQIETI